MAQTLARTHDQTLFEYSDYRSFLNAHAQTQRQRLKNWSYGVWARQLNLSATASLTMVLNGQRKPGPKMAQQFAKYFSFNERERRYFFDLVQLEKVQHDSHLKVLVLEELRRLSPKGQFQFLDDKTFSLISNWYFYALRQMCRMSPPLQDAEDIRARLLFPLTRPKIRAAIQSMCELGLLEKDSSTGALRATAAHLKTSEDIQSEALRRFHEEVLKLSQQSVRKFSPQERELRAVTLSFSTAQLPQVQARIREFSDALAEEFGVDGGDSVFQLAIQFFPLARMIKKGRHK